MPETYTPLPFHDSAPHPLPTTFTLSQLILLYGFPFQESTKNSVKDFLHVAGPLGVTHFLIFSATKEAPYLRIARTPRGPTLTFKIESYTLAADIAKAQTRPLAHAGIYESAPLVRKRYSRMPRGTRANLRCQYETCTVCPHRRLTVNNKYRHV